MGQGRGNGKGQGQGNGKGQGQGNGKGQGQGNGKGQGKGKGNWRKGEKRGKIGGGYSPDPPGISGGILGGGDPPGMAKVTGLDGAMAENNPFVDMKEKKLRHFVERKELEKKALELGADKHGGGGEVTGLAMAENDPYKALQGELAENNLKDVKDKKLKHFVKRKELEQEALELAADKHGGGREDGGQTDTKQIGNRAEVMPLEGNGEELGGKNNGSGTDMVSFKDGGQTDTKQIGNRAEVMPLEGNGEELGGKNNGSGTDLVSFKDGGQTDMKQFGNRTEVMPLGGNGGELGKNTSFPGLDKLAFKDGGQANMKQFLVGDINLAIVLFVVGLLAAAIFGVWRSRAKNENVSPELSRYERFTPSRLDTQQQQERKQNLISTMDKLKAVLQK